MSKKYPEPLEIDGEVVRVHQEDIDHGAPIASVGRHFNLSPYEAEQLRDWLTDYLEVYYKNEQISKII